MLVRKSQMSLFDAAAALKESEEYWDSFQCLTVAGQQRNPNSDPEVDFIRHPALRGATSKETEA